MQTIESIQAMQSLALKLHREGKRVGFVPTMGSLHEGHLSLVDLAKKHADVVVVSIYVNPIQFGPNEDFTRYPRNLQSDLQRCTERGVDVVFVPKDDELYPSKFSTYIVEESLSATLCGVSRPNFYRGVCTIVGKLFNIVRPDIAVFGQKDAQQAVIIKKMVRELHFPVGIVVGSTVRDEDDLAMSSRNTYLTDNQRVEARAIYRSLCKAREMVASGMRNPDRLMAEIIHLLGQHRRLRVIYVAIVDRETLETLREVIPGQALIATAVWCDEVRLIDNVLV